MTTGAIIYTFAKIAIVAASAGIWLLFIAWTMYEGSIRRKTLKHGGVLSPLTHPSYSDKKRVALLEKAAERDIMIEEANREFAIQVNYRK